VRVRIASLAVLLGAATTAVSWISLMPSLKALLDAAAFAGHPYAQMAQQLRSLLPFYLGLDLSLVTVIAFIALELTVGRPLRETEEAVSQLGRLEHTDLGTGGPLLSRLRRAIRRTSDELSSQRTMAREKVSELEDANQALLRAQTELVAADRLATVGKLAAGVAHEVGNPLSGILGYLSVARGKASPEQKDLLDRIEAEVQRIDRIVRSLLDLGRPSRGKPQPMELLPVVEACAQLLKKGELEKMQLKINVEKSVWVIAEAGPLSQVLINLLINAAQAMGGSGELEVSAVSGAGRVKLSVLDRGPGVPKAVAARLFEPFFTTKAAGKGTGLGLAVSKHLLEQMGGTLLFHDREGGGAVFEIDVSAPA
jgi:C4-dicarboxylate-specific signal transduction histidine kinase